MKDTFHSIQEMLLLGHMSSELGISSGCLDMAPDGRFTVKKPLLSVDGQILAIPENFPNAVLQAWDSIQKSIKHLTSPFTPFNHLGHGIKPAAIEVVQSSITLQQLVNRRMRILLPPCVSIKPEETFPKEIMVGRAGVLRYNAWVIPVSYEELPQSVMADHDGNSLTLGQFQLTLTTATRSHSFNIEFPIKKK